MNTADITTLRPLQWELVSRLHGSARRNYLTSAASCSALLIIVPVLLCALGLEYALMAHTMNVLLDVGGPEQPVTLLALSSLLAIAGLHIIGGQLQGTKLHDWLARLGLLALLVFTIGFGLIVSLTSFEIAASVLFNPETGLEAIDAWIEGNDAPADPESIGLKIKNAFGDLGGSIALVMAALGLGGVFFISMLVSHFLIVQGLRLARGYVDSRVVYKESRRLFNRITAKETALREAKAELKRLQSISKAQIVNEAVAELVITADRALAQARRAGQLQDLVKDHDRQDAIGTIGLSFLGIQEEAFAIDSDAFKAELDRVSEAVSEDALRKIGINVAKGVSG